MRYLSWIVALVLTGAGLCQAAELGQKVRKDLAPLDGRIIAVRTDDFLIDQDATAGVRDGDLFAVIRPGQSVRDPQTGKVLGREETAAAILRVTQVMRGFSKAAPLGGRTGTIRQGDAIRRYALLKTVFWDYTGRGENVYTEVRESLPDLNWTDYGAAQSRRPKAPAFSGTGEDLFFILKSSALEVRDSQGRLIKAYDKKPDVMPVAGGATPAPVGKAEMIGTLPMSVRIADIVLDGDRNLLAATDEKYVRVYALGDEAVLQASWSPDTADRILAVRWWRPDRQGPLYLAATLWADTGLRGARGVILRWQGNTLNLVETVALSVLGTFDSDGDGVPETLLKQEFNSEYFFGRRVKTLRWSGDRLSSEPLKETLPKGFQVTGSVMADLNGDGKVETAIVKNGFLFIYQGRRRLYKSPHNVGGSINTLTFNATPGMQDYQLETVRFELSPLWYDFDGNGRKELVVPAAEGVNRIMPGLPASVDRSWMSLVRFEQGHFSTKKLSDSFEWPIQGLGISPRGVVFLTTQLSDSEGAHGQATVYRLPVRATP